MDRFSWKIAHNTTQKLVMRWNGLISNHLSSQLKNLSMALMSGSMYELNQCIRIKSDQNGSFYGSQLGLQQTTSVMPLYENIERIRYRTKLTVCVCVGIKPLVSMDRQNWSFKFLIAQTWLNPNINVFSIAAYAYILTCCMAVFICSP